jgi:thiamine pyrophosphate-dependent acetolactate synthase large subunit-like protein
MSSTNLLDRRAVVATLLKDRGDAIAVGGLGASTYDIAAAGDHDRNFYLWGAMGGAVMIGLGVALAQPKLPVVVVTGDGEMLMGMGSLATVGLQKPGNLTIIVLDNEVYGETGGQASHTGASTDLVGIARCCGIGTAAISRPWPRSRLLPRRCRTSPAALVLPRSRSILPISSACSPTATARSL